MKTKRLIPNLLTLVCVLALPFTNYALGATEQAIHSYRQRQEDVKPADVLNFLVEGNKRFAAGISNHGGYPLDARERIEVSATGQRPIAAVLSCIDSRTTPELVFDTSVGDLFTARVGANVINEDIVGSFEIAAESGAKLIVVMGHSDCGGIKAACNNVELGHFTQLLERIKPVISAANALLDADTHLSEAIGDRVTTNRKYVAHVSHLNAQESAKQLRDRSPLLRAKFESGEVVLKSALYDVDTGMVNFDDIVLN